MPYCVYTCNYVCAYMYTNDVCTCIYTCTCTCSFTHGPSWPAQMWLIHKLPLTVVVMTLIIPTPSPVFCILVSRYSSLTSTFLYMYNMYSTCTHYTCTGIYMHVYILFIHLLAHCTCTLYVYNYVHYRWFAYADSCNGARR